MHWLEWRLWGFHAAGYHVVNVLLHAIGAVLVWRVLRRLEVPGAWLAGVALRGSSGRRDSAAWITEGKNTLLDGRSISSLDSWTWLRLRGVRARRLAAQSQRHFPLRTPQSALSLSRCSSSSALLAKSPSSSCRRPAAVRLVAARRHFRGGTSCAARRSSRSSLALGLVTVWFQHHNAIPGVTVRPEGVASRLAAAGWIAWFYLYKLLLPAGLCAIYPRWNVGRLERAAFAAAGALRGRHDLALDAGRARAARRCSRWRTSLIALLPVLGFVDMLFMRLSLVADHFQYLAMIGVSRSRRRSGAGGAARGSRPGAPCAVRRMRRSSWASSPGAAPGSMATRATLGRQPLPRTPRPGWPGTTWASCGKRGSAGRGDHCFGHGAQVCPAAL